MSSQPEASSMPRSRLRLFMVSYHYEPKIRGGMGGFQVIFELGRQFGKRHSVTLFLPAHSRRASPLDCVWIPVIPLPLLRVISFNLMLIPAMLVRAWTGRPDVIFERVFNSIVPMPLAKMLGSRYVVQLNGNPLQFYREHKPRAVAWVRRLVSRNLRNASSIVALTEGLKEQVRSDFGVSTTKVHVAPSGSNSELFFPRDRFECRKNLSIAADAWLAVFTGTFYAYQGIGTLLTALSSPTLRDLQVWLLGDGVMRDAWERKAAVIGLSQVRFTGQVDYDRVPAFLATADFCLAPFDPERGEVSPLKVLDYIFCARPTVIARIPSVENLIREFPSLLPFEPGNVASLIHALETMLKRRDYFAEQARLDSQKAIERYSWERIALGIEAQCLLSGVPS